MCVHPWFNQSFWAVFNMNGGRDVSFGLSWVVNAITNIWHLVGAHHCPSLRNHCYSVLEILAGFSAAETSGSIFWMTSQIPPLIYSRYMSFMSVANSDFRPPDFGPFLLQLRWKSRPSCRGVKPVSEVLARSLQNTTYLGYLRYPNYSPYISDALDTLGIVLRWCTQQNWKWCVDFVHDFEAHKWIVKIHEIGYWSLIICNLKTHK